MKTSTVRLLVLFALLGVTFFGAVRPAQAQLAGPPPFCSNPEYTVFETLAGLSIPPFWNGFSYNMDCKSGVGYAGSPQAGQPAELSLFDGFASVTIYGVPGVDFKAFLYQHVPQPLVVPEGWYIYGYGVDIFHNDANVNPDGFVCFGLPAGVLGNFEVGVFSFDGENFSRMSSNACGYFTGGGSFFLLMQTSPAPYFWPLDLRAP